MAYVTLAEEEYYFFIFLSFFFFLSPLLKTLLQNCTVSNGGMSYYPLLGKERNWVSSSSESRNAHFDFCRLVF